MQCAFKWSTESTAGRSHPPLPVQIGPLSLRLAFAGIPWNRPQINTLQVETLETCLLWYDMTRRQHQKFIEIQESHEVVKANLAFIKIMRGTVNTTTWYVDKRNHSISWTGGLVKTALRFESVNWTYTPLFHGGALGLAWSKLRLTKIMPDCQAGSTASGL